MKTQIQQNGHLLQDAFHYALLAAGGSFGRYETQVFGRGDIMNSKTQRRALARAKRLAKQSGVRVGSLPKAHRKTEVEEQGRWVAALIFAAATDDRMDANSGEPIN